MNKEKITLRTIWKTKRDVAKSILYFLLGILAGILFGIIDGKIKIG